MTNWKYLFLLIFILFSCSSSTDNIAALVNHSEKQLKYALEIANSIRDTVLVSPRTIEDGKLKLVKSSDWTSGFFPGNLWMMYEMTGNDYWKDEAIKLRDRVGMPHLMMDPLMDPRYENDGVSALIVEIRRERRIELFMEGFRYDDLRRWKQGKKLESPDLGIRWDANMQSIIDPEGLAEAAGTIKTTLVDGVPYIDVYQGTDWANPVFNESKNYLWPIPLSAIAQNPNISQTPGWN